MTPKTGDAALVAAAMKLDEQLAERPAEVHRLLNLDGQRGPNRLQGPTPSQAASLLSARLALDALARLRAAEWRTVELASELRGEPVGLEDGWEVHPPGELDPHAAAIGLPLLAACSEDAMAAATFLLPAKQYIKLTPQHTKLAERLSRFPLYEHQLWEISGRALGGLSRRVPYAFAFYALEWFWDPRITVLVDSRLDGAKEKANSRTLCLACGRPFRRRRASTLPRCPSCQDDAHALEFPPRAIMPGDGSEWWFKCPGRSPDCTVYFQGPRNQEFCKPCKARNIPPAKRALLR